MKFLPYIHCGQLLSDSILPIMLSKDQQGEYCLCLIWIWNHKWWLLLCFLCFHNVGLAYCMLSMCRPNGLLIELLVYAFTYTCKMHLVKNKSAICLWKLHFFEVCKYCLFIYIFMHCVINRWALSHPMSLKQFEKLKKKQMKPEFLDMVPWYSGYAIFLISSFATYMVYIH